MKSCWGQAEDQVRLMKDGNVCVTAYVCHASFYFIAGWARECQSPWGPQALLRPFHDAVSSRPSRFHNSQQDIVALDLSGISNAYSVARRAVRELIELGYAIARWLVMCRYSRSSQTQ